MNGNQSCLSESRKVHFKVIHHSPPKKGTAHIAWLNLLNVNTIKQIIIIFQQKEKEINPRHIILFLITRMNKYNKLKL